MNKIAMLATLCLLPALASAHHPTASTACGVRAAQIPASMGQIDVQSLLAMGGGQVGKNPVRGGKGQTGRYRAADTIAPLAMGGGQVGKNPVRGGKGQTGRYRSGGFAGLLAMTGNQVGSSKSRAGKGGKRS